MAEPSYRTSHDPDQAHEATPAGGVPGKMPVTARLSGRSQVIFRVESAGAARELASAFGPRDTNGVAADSDVAVDRAASSSGQLLPEAVRGRFEASLGTDLSGVRVHTGEASAQAAEAVGAKAYTTGNDIHFGAGQYDPSSAFGAHLLAHEVAHTVQQQGAAPSRQHKLEVSGPQDNAELEADRAATAMLAGAPASVATVAPAIARKPKSALWPDAPDDLLAEPSNGMETTVKPVIWTNQVGAPEFTLDYVAEVKAVKPTYTPESSLLPSAPAAFSAAMTDSTTRLTSLLTTLVTFRADAAAAEKASAGVATADPLAGMDNLGVEGADIKAAGAFDANHQVKVDPKKTSTKVLEREKSMEIFKLKDSLKTATKSVKIAAGKVEVAKNGIADAADAVESAAISVNISTNSEKGAELGVKQEDWEHEKARVLGALAGIKALVGVGKGLATAAAKPGEGLAEMTDAAFDLVDAGVNQKYDQKIAGVKKELVALNVVNAKLSTQKDVIAYNVAKRGVFAASVALDEANLEYEKAITDRKQIYGDLSLKVEALIKANGGSKKDQSNAQAAVQAVPLMEELIGKLDALAISAAPPPYTEESGKGAFFCTNLLDSLENVATLKGYAAEANRGRAYWKKRLDSVTGMIGGIK